MPFDPNQPFEVIDAPKQKASFDPNQPFEVISTQGGEQNEVSKQSKPEANTDSNEQRQANEQVQPSNEAGLQPSEVQLPESQGQEQRVGNVNANLSIDTPFQTGGENIAETKQATEGSQGKEAREGLRGQIPSGNEAQVGGAFGVQPPKPKEETFLGNAYEAGLSGYKGLGTMSSELGRYIWDLSKNIISLNASTADAIFGKNEYTESVRKNILEKGDKYYADQIKGSELSPDEAKKPLNQFIFGAGHMLGDLALAGMTAGESAAAKGVFTLAETPAIKAIAEQAIHGMRAFTAPSLIASNEAITKAKEDGEDDASALAEGMKTLFETELGAALPMNVSSGLKNVLSRTASRILQATPLAVAQSELVQAAENTYERAFGDGEKVQPTISENIIEGNFETAAMQLAQSAPMGLLGAIGGDSRKIGKKIANAELPETAAVIEESAIEDRTLRLNELNGKSIEQTKQNEEQIQETSGVSTEQGKPTIETTAVKTEEGATQRQGEGQEEVIQDQITTTDSGGKTIPKQYGPGASADLELYNKDVQLGTQIIQGNKGITYEAWKGIIEPTFDEGKYTENELRDLYDNAQGVAKIADTGVPVPEAVKQVVGTPINPKSANSLKNAELDAVRQSMGLSRLSELARQGQEALFDRVMYMMDDDPYYKSRVLSKAKENPNEPLSPEDRVVLLHELTAIRTEYDRMLKAITEEKDPENQQMMKDRLKQLQDQYLEMSEVARLTVRSTAQALNLQKAFVRDDFSNLGMLRKFSADVIDRPEKFGGNTPTKAEIEKIQQQAERITALEKELSERVEKDKAESMDEDLEIFTKEAQSESKKTDPVVQRILDVIAEKLGTQAQSARERIQQRRREGRLNAGLDPTDLADHAIIGADYIVKGTSGLAEWSVKMINEFGDYVKPYLDQIFKAANEAINNEIGVAVETSKEKRISKQLLKSKVAAEAKRYADQSPDGKIQRAIKLIRENLGDDEVIGSIVRGLAKAVHAKAYRSGNMLNRNQFADAVHKIVSREIEGWSEVNTKEAMVGYGIFKQLTKEAEAVRLRELNGEIRELSKQTDIREGNAPKKSGAERPPKGTGERIEVKKTKALLKEFGITVKDPDTQLAGAMDAIKNRLRNHIEELTQRITTGERAPKKQPIAYDEEATALKAERDALQEQFDTLYGKTERTMEEKVAAYEISNQKLIEAKKKAIADERERIAAGKKYTPKQKEKLTSPKLEEQKEQLAQLSEEAKLVRDSDYLRKEEVKQVSLAKRLKAIEEEILGIAKKKEKEQGPVSGPVAFLQGKLKEAEAKLKDFRDSQKVKKTEDEQILQKLNNQRAAAEERLARLQNEQKKVTGKKSMVLNEEQRKVQNEIDDLNKQSKEYQEASKKRTTQEERNIKSWERRIALLEKQREARGAKSPKKPAEPMTERELALQKAHAELKAEIKQDDWYIENRGNLAIEAYRNQLIKRKENFIRRSAEKDFAPRVRVEKAFDPVAEKLKAEVEKVKNEFEEDRRLAQFQSRSKFERALMYTVAWKRSAVLYYVSTLGKLFAASIEIPLMRVPLSAAGVVLRQIPVYKQIAKLAPSEGGGKISEDIKEFASGFYTGASEAYDIGIKQGESNITLLNREETGAAVSKIPKNIIFNMPQKLHEAIKNPTKQGIYRMSLQRHLNYLHNKGIEIYGPEGEPARKMASIGAFKDAEDSIFLGNNALVKFYNSIVQQALGSKNAGVRSLGYTAQEFIPIVRIPLNIIQFTVEAQVGLPLSFVRILSAKIHGGLENISPEEANAIMRQAKAGSIGLMMLMIGAANPSYFGGLHREGKKPDEDELQFGEAMIMGIKIPKQFMHIPLLNCLQIGATVRQIIDEKIEDAEGLGDKAQVVASAMLESELNFVKEVPFINIANEISQYFNIKRIGPTFGALVRSNIPGFIQETARWIDRDEDGKKIKRESKTFLDVVSQGLPFVRQTVTPKE